VSTESVVKSTAMKAPTMKAPTVETSTVKSATVETSAGETTVEATTTSMASASATTMTTSAGRRYGRLNQADGRQCQQRQNRFPQHGSLHLLDDRLDDLLDGVAPETKDTFAARLFERSTVNWA
jgi:hypothetical protein